jgi:hypothetical protein
LEALKREREKSERREFWIRIEGENRVQEKKNGEALKSFVGI